MQQPQTAHLDPGVGEESIFFIYTVSLAVSIVGAFKKVVSGGLGSFFFFRFANLWSKTQKEFSLIT